MRAIFVLAFVLVYCAEFSLCNEESDQASYSNSWAVHVGDLDQDAVTQIATKYGFTNRGQIGKLHGYYLFEKNKAHLKHSRRRRSAEEEEDHRELLMSEPKIHWVKQQRILERSKRNVISDESHESRNGRDMAVSVQDPYYKDQWYLQNIGQSSGPSGLDINVLPVWGRGYTGQGVVVSILDDGVDHTHPDLRKNYDPSASFDFNDFDPDPTPRSTDPLNCHGTRCAGEVAAEANNGICGVGVSFNASVGGIRMLDGVATDVIESLSLGYRSDYIDIYTSCWGPKDDGKRFGKPGFLASKSLKIGAEKGRGGKGNIFVWATGNGGLTDDDCNCDGYTTSIYTISIGAISDHGLSTYYTETCASTIAVTFSGASHREADENKIVTTDLNHQCTETFKGTSSAAPLAAGMLALVLEANPHLTWRDVQHIIVETSQKTSAFDEGWKTNGAGKQFNHKFGFGKMDAMKMVDAALKWKLVPKQRVCHDTKYDTKRNIPSSGSLILSANTQSCADTTSEVRKLEHVQVVVTLKHRRRGDLSFDLISPSGTRSRLLKTRRNDKSTEGLTDWVFMTVHFWGENPKGSWSLVITDNDRNTREHHVTKAKQGDMEDVQRVFMDDSEKRGNWDASVINEYERRNQTSPRNTTMHDHILKSIEDTTGELVKGNKFTELAKRLKNRRKKLPKVNYFHAMHARKANKIPKKPTTVKSSKNPSQKHLKHWHNTAKHKSHHKGSHHKHRDHHKTAHHHKVHKKRTHPAAKHSNDVLKAKKGTKHSKQNKKKLNQENYGNDDSKLSTINSKGTGIDHKHAYNEEEDSESPMAEGSIEIPPGSPAEAKLALQALANPLIQKIIGLSRTARFFPKTLHNTLAGEVDVNMKVLDNGYKKALNTKAQTKKLSSLEKKAQHKHVKAKLSTKSDDNVYANILKSINGLTGKNTKEKLLNQVNIIHDNLTDSEQSLTGTNAKESVITGKESKSSKLSENDFTKTKSQSKYSTAIKRPLVGSISTDESTNESAQGENHSNGSDYTGRALTGKAHQSGSAKNLEKVDDKENSEKVDSAPLIFFDDDSKRYVAVSKVEPNNTSTPLVVAEEGTGSGNHEMNTTEGHGEEGSGIPIGETADCEETGSDGECLNNDDNEYLKENFENGDDDSNIRKNVHNKHKKKEPKDDFGAVGFDGYDGSKKQTTGSKLLADNNVPLSDFKPNGVGMPDNTDLTGSENAHSKGNENAQSTGSEDVHSTGSEDAQSTRSETAQSTGSENAHPTGSEDAQSTGSENAHPTGGAIGESESDDGMYPLDRTIHENKLGNETMSNKYTTGSNKSPTGNSGSRAKLQTGSNLEERKPVKSNYHPSIEDKTGSKLMTLNDYTGYQNDQPETNVTVNTDGHTNGENGELKDQRNVFQDSENIDYGNTTQLRPKTMESSSVNSPINKVENNKFNHDINNQNNAFMWHENAGYLNNENDTTETKTYDHSKDYGIHNDQLKLNVIDNQADEKYMQRHFENDDVDTRNTKIHETATAKNKTNEPQLKDDFGLVGGDKHRFTNEVRTHEHDTSYSAFKNETFDKYDREAMKSRLEAEYGRVDSSLTKEDFDTMRYNSLAAQLKDRGRVLPNEEFFEKPIGSDIPGSENDTNSQGYKKGGNFFDHYIGEAITGQSDSIEGSVNDDINDDLLDSSAEEYHPSYVQSKIVTSGDDREISRNYMIDNQNSTEGQSQVIEKSLSDKKLQTLNRKLHKQQHSNDAPNMKHLNDEMVPSVALFKATIKLNTQNNVPTGAVTDNQHNALKRPVNALPTTHNKAPKGSSFKAALPPASPESPSPIIVKAIDAAFIAPTPTPKIEMVQKELSQNQPKTPPQEKLAQYAPTNYVPETQAQGQEEGLLDSHKVPVPDDQETPALETNKIPDQLQEMHNNEPDNEDREQRHYLQESEDNTESSPTPSLLRQSKQGESTFLQRVQQDIEQRNVEDLEHLENEVKKEMEKTMNLLTNDPNEQLYRNILTSNDQSEESDDSDSMLYRRSLARGASNDHVPTKQTSMKIEVKQGIDHSGVLESWNLIFYGT